MSEHGKFDLDEREAFAAMSLFMNRFAERAGDDLITLLTDIRVMDDGVTWDPAAWADWLQCVRDVKGAANEPAEEVPSDG